MITSYGSRMENFGTPTQLISFVYLFYGDTEVGILTPMLSW